MSIRKLAVESRFWVLFMLLALTLTVSACSSSDESSCHPDDEDYPECLDTGATG